MNNDASFCSSITTARVGVFALAIETVTAHLVVIVRFLHVIFDFFTHGELHNNISWWIGVNYVFSLNVSGS